MINGEVTFTTLKREVPPAEEQEFSFCGVIWRHSSRRIKRNDEVEMPGVIASGRWHGTHRLLARVLGKLLWYHRVCETPRYREETVALFALYGKTTPPEERDWNSAVTLDEEATRVLATHWSARARDEWTDSRVFTTGGDVALAAVDASSTESFLGGVIYAPDGRVRAVQDTHEFVQTEIALAELTAIQWMVSQLIRENPQLGLIVLATDSMNAKSWVENERANNEKANAILDTIFRALGERQIFLVWVPTDDNAADDPSRNKGLVARRVASTLALLKFAQRQAVGVWRLDARQSGGVRRQRVE